jgi:uncharacterized protein YjbI with pentapeptide repeats
MVLGELEREFLVIGETGESELRRAEPKPFLSVPLSWDMTSKSPENPLGIEQHETRTSDGAPAVWPRVFDFPKGFRNVFVPPGGPFPDPACPLPRPGGPDFSKSGTYDRKWLLKRWPALPGDADPEAFCLAQEKQRLKRGFFRGDENFLLGGVHPECPELSGFLPGKTARVFARTGDNPSDLPLREIPMVLDTVWFFPTALAGLLVWHGELALSDGRSGKIETIVAFVEDASREPLDPAEVARYGEQGEIPGLPTVVLPEPGKKPVPVPPPAPLAPETPPETPPGAPAVPAAPALAAAAAAPSAPSAPSAFVPPAVPAVVPPAAPAIAPLPDADEIVASVREDIEKNLPDLNKVMADEGFEPVKIEDFDPYLAKEKEKLAGLLKTPGIGTAGAPGGASDLADAEALPFGDFEKIMTESGMNPLEAAKAREALSMPVPLASDFPDEAAFEAALKTHGEKWASLLGLPPERGDSVAAKIKAAGKAASGDMDPDEAFAALAGADFGPEKLRAFEKAGNPVGSLGAADPDALPPGLARGLAGLLGEKEAADFAAALRELEASAGAGGFLALRGGVKDFLVKVSASLGTSETEALSVLDREMDIVRRVAWGGDETGEALAALARVHPGLAPRLPELNRLRTGDYGDVMSLADLARKAGVTEAPVLAAVAGIDPLNPGPAIEVPGAAREFEAEGKGGDNEPAPSDDRDANPFPEGRVFVSREEFERALKTLRARNETSLGAAVLTGLNLSGLKLSDLDMRGVYAAECDFANSDLSRSNLSGALFGSASFEGATLDRAKAAKTDFQGIKGTPAGIRDADFPGADFSGADLRGFDFRRANAPGADFAGAFLPSDFREANLSGARFGNGDLSLRDFSGADLSGASFDSANLSGAKFRGAISRATTFADCDLSGAVFAESFSEGLRICLDTVLNGADFDRANLRGARFSGRSAANADFEGVKADGADFSSLDLTGADFEGASLREAVFFEADLTRAVFDGAGLMRASFGSAILKGASFAGASLYGANLFGATIDDDTDFGGADLNSTIIKALARVPGDP